MSPELEKARCIAECILHWHISSPVIQLLKLPLDAQEASLITLRRLRELDLSEVSAMKELCAAQVGGSLEWFYNERIPKSMWVQFVSSRFDDLPVPASLGHGAGMIRTLLDRAKDTDTTVSDRLKPIDTEVPVRFNSMSDELPVVPGKSSTQLLREYFSPLDENSRNLGGRELMVAMNQDAEVVQYSDAETLTVYNPSAFHFEVITEEDTVVWMVLNGMITVEEIILGCDSSYGEYLNEAEEI